MAPVTPVAPVVPAVQTPPAAGPTFVFNLPASPSPKAAGDAPAPPPLTATETTPPELATSVDKPDDAKEQQSAPPAGRKININTATIEELDLLPGIGRSTAQKIIDYRIKHGKFRTISELDKVSGIGPARLEQLRPLVTVD
ncbi:MAG: ComEA family DNA-binding protein [Planctomycetota bacterium]